MPGLVVDTHALVWYLLGSPNLLEKGRLPEVARMRATSLIDDPESGLVLAPIDRGVFDAVPRVDRDSIPDMPDRIIAATALHLGLPLVTRDRKIRAAEIETIW